MRTNAPSYGKRTPFTRTAFADFVIAYTGGTDIAQVRDVFDGTVNYEKRAAVQDTRWNCITREEITKKNDSLDLGLIADSTFTSKDDSDKPLDIVIGAAEELKAIQKELNQLIELLR